MTDPDNLTARPTREAITRRALAMLRSYSYDIEDARKGAANGNSAAGNMLSIIENVPREEAEAAVLDALALIDLENS